MVISGPWSPEELAALAYALPHPAWVLDADGIVLALNPAWEAYTGMKAGEGIREGWKRVLPPEDLDAFLAERDRSFAAGEAFRLRPRIRNARGEYRTHHVRVVPLRDGRGDINSWFGQALDIEEEVAGERNARTLFETVAANTASALLLMDEDGYARYVNRAWEEMTGVTLEQMRGKPAHYSVHHTRPDGTPYPMEECPVDRANADLIGIREVEDWFVRPDGTFYPVSCSAMPLEQDGVRFGAVVEARDITEQKHRESELRAALAAKDDFLSMVSHELRTPLTTVTGNAMVLRSRISSLKPDDIDQSLGDIVHAAERLAMLIDNMLALARLERGLVPEREPAHVYRIAERVVERHRRQNPERSYAVVEHSERRPVLVSPEYIDQVLDNLLSNAEKYGGDGPIEVRIDRQEHHVAVQVLDRGPGIADVGRAFEPFVRGANESNKPGLGLGLALCKRMIEAQGGEMWARLRDDGPGSDVGFTLPLATDDSE